MKNLLVFCLLLLSIKDGYGQTADTFYIYFSINDTRVNKDQEAYLDSLISLHLLVPAHKLRVLGYTDNLGSQAHNDSLSRARAKNVQQHLLASGFNDQDITLCMGEGEIRRAHIDPKEGYAGDRKVLLITDRHRIPDSSGKKDIIDINQVEINETVSLKNIFFTGGLPEISPYSMPELKQLYNFLKINKKVTIQIEGHICCLPSEDGTDEPYDTSTLSTMRAKAVYDYLISKGIENTRLKYIGLGNTKPSVSPEQSEEDMERNRRVEIRILSK